MVIRLCHGFGLLGNPTKIIIGIAAGNDSAAILTHADDVSRNNRLIIEGGTIGNGFDYGVFLRQGGTLRMRGTEIDATKGLWLGATPNNGGRFMDVVIDGVHFGEHVFVTECIPAGDSRNEITHRNMILETSNHGLETQSGLHLNTYRGRRILLVENTPNTMPGLVGDVARIATPQAGMPYEWVCTASSPTSATWKLLTSVAN